MTHINQRRATAAQWTAANPVLQLGEVGWETDTLRAKLGDGLTAWNALDYATMPPTDLSGYALLDSPEFIGNPTAPTPTPSTNDNSIATTEFVNSQGFAPLASPTFTGNPKAPTPATADNDTSVATTEFVKAQGYAPLASPALTGNPTAPTPAASDNDTSLATTAFVKNALAGFFEVDTLSAEFIVTDMTFAVIPGMDITFTSLGPEDVFEVHLNIDAELPTSAWLVAAPRVDGAVVSPPQGSLIFLAGGPTRAPLAKSYKVTGLAAGEHSLTVYAYQTPGPGGTPRIFATHTEITIKRIVMHVPAP